MLTGDSLDSAIPPADPAQRARIEAAIVRGAERLFAEQKHDGHWVYELEADATIPAEYVLLRHYLGEPVDAGLEARIGVYLRRRQSAVHHGWPLYHDGGFDVSATIKAYYALKVIGDDVDAPHMARARRCWRRAGLRRRTSSPASSWRCSARGRGTWCRRSRPS
jgi:squalene-hopene/tetraprenyl-beta-curcumene cyclase